MYMFHSTVYTSLERKEELERIVTQLSNEGKIRILSGFKDSSLFISEKWPVSVDIVATRENLDDLFPIQKP